MSEEQKTTGGRANSLKNLRAPWKPGQSGNPKGRPSAERSPEKALKVVFGNKQAKLLSQLRGFQVNEWEEILIYMTQSELQTLIKWEDCPIYVKNIAVAMVLDMKNGNTKTIDKLRDRVYGKLVSKVEVTGKDGTDLIKEKQLTRDEARELIKQLENE